GQHAGQQLLGRLGRVEVHQLVLVARQHEPRLELEQGGDQHDELRRHLEIELAAGLEVVEVGQDDVGEIDLEQVDLLAQDQRQEQVEGTGEDVQVELELGEAHGETLAPGPDAHHAAHVGQRLGRHGPRLVGAGGE